MSIHSETYHMMCFDMDRREETCKSWWTRHVTSLIQNKAIPNCGCRYIIFFLKENIILEYQVWSSHFVLPWKIRLLLMAKYIINKNAQADGYNGIDNEKLVIICLTIKIIEIWVTSIVELMQLHLLKQVIHLIILMVAIIVVMHATQDNLMLSAKVPMWTLGLFILDKLGNRSSVIPSIKFKKLFSKIIA